MRDCLFSHPRSCLARATAALYCSRHERERGASNKKPASGFPCITENFRLNDLEHLPAIGPVPIIASAMNGHQNRLPDEQCAQDGWHWLRDTHSTKCAGLIRTTSLFNESICGSVAESSHKQSGGTNPSLGQKDESTLASL